ncbi:hypothetical protein TNCV_1251591 [Trichonephila clavipes]|nr:hypothetical protein TNCV_1251591 [Trichonephila clavipes]
MDKYVLGGAKCELGCEDFGSLEFCIGSEKLRIMALKSCLGEGDDIVKTVCCSSVGAKKWDGDIVLSLPLFERQAKRIGREKTNRVSGSLARMPPDKK